MCYSPLKTIMTKFPCSWDIFGNFWPKFWKPFERLFLIHFHWTASSFDIALLCWNGLSLQLDNKCVLKCPPSSVWNQHPKMCLHFKYPMRAFKKHALLNMYICLCWSLWSMIDNWWAGINEEWRIWRIDWIFKCCICVFSKLPKNTCHSTLIVVRNVTKLFIRFFAAFIVCYGKRRRRGSMSKIIWMVKMQSLWA